MTHLTVHEWGRVGVHNGGGTVPERHFSRGEANALWRLGEVELVRGDYAVARARLDASAKVARDVSDRAAWKPMKRVV